MRIHLTSFPRSIPLLSYDLAIERMVAKLQQQDGVVSIFQIGSIGSPGISDIDMLVVFEDGVKCSLNPRGDLSKTERYLFSHDLYGVSRKQFYDAQKYTMFNNYKLLYGEELPGGRKDLTGGQNRQLKTQIAMEYLMKMFIDSTVELTYGIVKIRGLLMHVKALSYDLEFLGVSSGRLLDLVRTIIGWRGCWFEQMPERNVICKWFREFYAVLAEFLELELRKQTFYLPKNANLRIASNMILESSQMFDYMHTGMRLPPVFGSLGRKYFNVQHRFNKFRFKVPAVLSNIPEVISERFAFARQMKHVNSKALPYFMPPISSLNIVA